MPITPETTTLSARESTKIRGCTPVQMLAVDIFFKNGFKKSLAAAEAGWKSTDTHTLWNAPAVKAEVQRRLRIQDSNRTKRATKFEVTEDEIMAEMCKIAFAPLETTALILKAQKKGGEVLTPEVEPLTEIQERFNATQSVAARDKKGALDSIAKMKGMFIEKLEITGDSLEARLLRGQQRIAKGGTNALEESTDTES